MFKSLNVSTRLSRADYFFGIYKLHAHSGFLFFFLALALQIINKQMGYIFEKDYITYFSGGMFLVTLEIFNLFWLLRRCNDIGVSKWWFSITIIPFTIFYFMCRAGSQKSNKYGEPIPLKDYWEGPVLFGTLLLTIAIKCTVILLIMNEADRYIR